MSDIKYEITERIAILSEKGSWTKELNMVSWNDKPDQKGGLRWMTFFITLIPKVLQN